MFLSKLWFVSERIPPFLLFSTLIHEIVQTLVHIVKSENMLTFWETKHPTFAGGVSNPAYLQCPSNYRFYYISKIYHRF